MSRVRRQSRARLRGAITLCLTSAIAVALTWPWGDYTGHTHWDNVGWIPFVSPPVRPLDILANLLVFAPTGVASGLAFRRPIAVAATVTLILSLATEAVQIYSHTRFPSATDVTCNVAGAILAAHVTAERKPRG